MDFNAIYHRANDNYCYPLDENRLIINIKTGYDVKFVNLIQGDPFRNGILGGGENWTGEAVNIPFKKRLSHQVWWTTTVEPQFKRLKYYFELQTDTEKYYYFEDGIVSEEQMNLEGRSRQCFVFPWLNPADVSVTPAWVNDTIWYQIYPERFCNGDPSLNPENTLPWRNQGSVTNEEFFGGDLPGIIQKLDYLKDLGITGIYTTPINEASTSHKYDTIDYEKIDPHFGDTNIMRSLVDEAHKRGIRVMVDGVFNHTGPFFKRWLEVVDRGPESPYYNWFMINNWPLSYDESCTLSDEALDYLEKAINLQQYGERVYHYFATMWNGKSRLSKNGEIYSFAFFDGMPKLNTNNPEVRDYLIGVCEKWVKDYDLDGLRLDVANEVSHVFCKELRLRLKAIKPDLYILGEIWHDAMPWLRGDEFDSVMNYPLGQSIKDFWIDKSLTNEDFEYTINRCYTRYMQQTNDVLFNLLDSHDTKRLRSDVRNLDEYFQQLCVLFAMPGCPCIYYGTEIAMEGGHDPDCRRCMPWDDIDSGKYNERVGIIKSLIALRESEPLMKGRDFHFPGLYGDKPRVIHFRKMGWIDTYVEIIINCEEADIDIPQEGEILFSRHLIDSTLLHGGILVRKVVAN